MTSGVYSPSKFWSGSIGVAAKETTMAGKKLRSKINSTIAKTIKIHVAMTAPILSSLKPLASQVPAPVSLRKRRAPHATENRNRIKNIAIMG